MPPTIPTSPEVREDWAQYYDKITEMDLQVGQFLAQLKQDGLEENTSSFITAITVAVCLAANVAVSRWFACADDCACAERLQRWAGDAYKSGTKSERLISFVDLVPTVLSLAGERPASHLQGSAFLGKYSATASTYLYAYRDRMDERVDMSRAVRDDQYLYIRNFYPHRPQGTHLAYMFETPTTQVWKRLFDAGKLNEAQAAFWKAKSPEELYDLKTDPYQIHNLASEPTMNETLTRMRGQLKTWMIEQRDLGLVPEGEVLERSGKDPAYAFARDPKRISMERVYEAADLAMRLEEGDLERLLANRVAQDSASRYWTVCGLLYRAQENRDREAIVKAANGMTTDSSLYVQCVANELMARYGSETQRKYAIEALMKLANAKETNAFVAIVALNSLDWCSPTRAELGGKLELLPTKVVGLSARYDSYLPRLVERVSEIAK